MGGEQGRDQYLLCGAAHFILIEWRRERLLPGQQHGQRSAQRIIQCAGRFPVYL